MREISRWMYGSSPACVALVIQYRSLPAGHITYALVLAADLSPSIVNHFPSLSPSFILP